MTRGTARLEGTLRAKAMTFLQKLAQNDALPGLHIEPIVRAADSRVRTGRVDLSWRAVMFRVDQGGEAHYVIHGIFPHDEANAVASRVILRVNPVNGLPQIEDAEPTEEPSGRAGGDLSEVEDAAGPTAVPAQPILIRHGHTADELTQRLGIPDPVAQEAMSALTEDDVFALAEQREGWLGYVLIDLATGDSIDSIVARMELEPTPSSGDDDTDLLRSLKRPAAATQFAFIDTDDELRRVIEEGDFGAWRVFLHPEQRRYVDRNFSGPARLTGGAGTGKTVVLVHRARALARRSTDARIVLTTFTTNLADSLRESLTALDPAVRQTRELGNPGVHVAGVDALAAAVIRAAGAEIHEAVRAVLGDDRSTPQSRLSGDRWTAALASASTGLAPEIANETFLSDEYALVVLPTRIRTEADYLRVRRPGRRVSLDRGKRAAVWAVIEAYRAQNRIEGALDFSEAAAVAAAWLQGRQATAYADSVLVDEGQDLSPCHWQLLRALVPEGPDDLLIAEDSHQRIYGPRVVLGHYGIRVVGRSTRLRLNYRTTAQNLRYALSMLEGGTYVDLDEEPEGTDYRSARSGPAPRVLQVAGLGEELEEIASQVRRWMQDGVDPGTAAVLVHDKFQRERVVAALGERGLAARAVDRERPPRDKVLVMTMHRAKGMEFSRVLLAGAGSRDGEQRRLARLGEGERRDAELRARSLLYVAATRARDELVVTGRESTSGQA